MSSSPNLGLVNLNKDRIVHWPTNVMEIRSDLTLNSWAWSTSNRVLLVGKGGKKSSKFLFVAGRLLSQVRRVKKKLTMLATRFLTISEIRVPAFL